VRVRIGQSVVAMAGGTRWGTQILNSAVALVTGLLGVVWAWAGPLAALATDEVPASQYEGYNTVGHTLSALHLMVVLPLLAWAVYFFLRRAHRPPWMAMAISQAPCLIVATLAFLGLASASPPGSVRMEHSGRVAESVRSVDEVIDSALIEPCCVNKTRVARRTR
jgi:hypothetical protein